MHLVRPEVVLEITFDQIQKSARHSSGYAFRFPRIKRIRTDKRPEDADTLARVAELYESTHNFGRTVPVDAEKERTLDEEARRMMDAARQEIAAGRVDGHELFRRIRRKLAEQRGIVL